MNHWLQHLAPHRLISCIANLIANNTNPLLKNYLIRYFLWRYPQVNLTEAIKSNADEYSSFNEFFTRKLNTTARPIANAATSIISPADGTISQWGDIINGNQLIQAKGHFFNLEDLLGGPASGIDSQCWYNGKFMTIYLAPWDYHRVHMPFAGQLEQMLYIPGKLFSVNLNTAAKIAKLYAKNERIVAVFNSEAGKMVVILVGAMIVGSMETTWHVGPVHSKEIINIEYTSTDKQIFLNKGEELGRFKLGSTVIMLFEPNQISWHDEELNRSNMAIKMGQAIAQALNK